MSGRIQDKSLEERKIEARRQIAKHPDRVPVIIQIKDKNLLDRCKYLPSKDMTVGMFLYQLRSRANLNESEGLFLFTMNNSLTTLTSRMIDVYEEYKSEDLFLYMILQKESIFG